jgi:3-hydroxyisobutyrate dehydrogenase
MNASPPTDAGSTPGGGVDRVAAIGLGAMGLPMAGRLVAEGLAVRGFDPSAERRRLARAAGVSTAATPAAAVPDAGVVVLAVRDEAQADQALFGRDGAAGAMTDGTTVVLTSTIGASAAARIARRLSAGGVSVVDAPVSGGPARAATGDLLVLAAAPDEDIARVRPVLARLASTLHVVGPRIGDGQLVKVINQLLAGVHIAAAAEAVALADAVGLDPAVVVDVLSTGAAGSFMLRDRGPRILRALAAEAEVKSRVDIFVKDMGLVADLARAAAVPVPVASAAQQLYLLAARAGLGAYDDSSIVRLLSRGEDSG